MDLAWWSWQLRVNGSCLGDRSLGKTLGAWRGVQSEQNHRFQCCLEEDVADFSQQLPVAVMTPFHRGISRVSEAKPVCTEPPSSSLESWGCHRSCSTPCPPAPSLRPGLCVPSLFAKFLSGQQRPISLSHTHGPFSWVLSPEVTVGLTRAFVGPELRGWEPWLHPSEGM